MRLFCEICGREIGRGGYLKLYSENTPKRIDKPRAAEYNGENDRGAHDKSTAVRSPFAGVAAGKGIAPKGIEAKDGPGKGNNILFTVAFAECYRICGLFLCPYRIADRIGRFFCE